MNILFLSTEIPFPLDHGHHLRTANVLKCLAEDHDIYFLGFSKNENINGPVQDLERFCASTDIFLIPEGKFRWRFYLGLLLNLISLLPFAAKKYHLPAVHKRIRKLLVEEKIDLIHIDATWLALYYQDFKNYPSILTTHNVESDRLLGWIKIEKNFITKIYLYFQYIKLLCFERSLWQKFDRCIVVSERDKEILSKNSIRCEFSVIPNGVDVNYFRPNPSIMEMNNLVWVGPMNDPYNRDAVNYFVKDIYPLIVKNVPEIQVNFIGVSPTSYLRKIAERDKRINVLGYVQDIRPYVDQATIYIAPLRAGGGTKLKVLNALSQGKAVVTTSIGAEGITGVSNSNILIADDPGEFAKKTEYLLRNLHIVKQMGQNGRDLVMKYYDWGIIYKKIKQIYRTFEN